MRLTPAQTAWIDRARDADILSVAQRSPVNAKLKKHSREWIGPCPRCGGTDRFAINPGKKGGVFNCRGSGAGGDVISLVRHVVGCEFLTACELINGEPMPAADSKISKGEIEAAAEQRERERAEADKKREAEHEAWCLRMRQSAYAIWKAAEPFAGSIAETYLREVRGIRELPDGLRLRFAPKLAFCHGEEDDGTGRMVARVIHRGPALLGAGVDGAGKFRALHRQYLDLDQPDGKAKLIDPDSGKEIDDKKKSLGSLGGAAMHLVDGDRRLYIGEGIETVLSVWYAMHAAGRDLSGCAFWCAFNLGNLGGKHSGTVAHPFLKDAGGKPQRIQGPEPDLKGSGIAIPDSVEDIVLLGDGDSDRFTTHCALYRGARRFRLNSEAMTRIGRTVRVAWAPEGRDFNDELLRAA